jgi:protein gp37
MAATIIAWTDYTFNPWMGCTKVSAGCKNCYAERFVSKRMGLSVWGPSARRQITKSPWGGVARELKRDPGKEPGVLGAGYPRTIFIGSLMDWAEDRADLVEPRNCMWKIIRNAPHAHFQLLTKRPDNILHMLPPDWGNGWANVWLGTSIEDQSVAARADALRSIPAAVRFVSYEPAIGKLRLNLDGIHWVIYGGESGPGYRPEDKLWARYMRADCAQAGAAFFHKQSTGFRTELGIELDGKIVREFPLDRVKQAIATGYALQ